MVADHILLCFAIEITPQNDIQFGCVLGRREADWVRRGKENVYDVCEVYIYIYIYISVYSSSYLHECMCYQLPTPATATQ